MKTINEAKIGQNIKTAVVVVSISQQNTRSGKPYLNVVLRDRTGSILTNIWDTAIADAPFKPNDVLELYGFVDEYNGTPQLKVQDFNVLADANFMDYLPGITAEQRAELVDELRQHAVGMKHPLYYQLLQQFYNSDEFKSLFCYAPAGAKMHSAYVGGLLFHTAHVCRIAKGLSSKPNDLLITGAVLHDVGKMFTYQLDAAFSYTKAGALLEHIILGILHIQKMATEHPDYNKTDLLHLLHLIASHHGKPEWGSPVYPQTETALLLHQADLTATRLEMLRETVQDANGNGAQKSFKLGHNVWVE